MEKPKVISVGSWGQVAVCSFQPCNKFVGHIQKERPQTLEKCFSIFTSCLLVDFGLLDDLGILGFSGLFLEDL
jgi:hypothetical protein